jgi:hypothetical protein
MGVFDKEAKDWARVAGGAIARKRKTAMQKESAPKWND